MCPIGSVAAKASGENGVPDRGHELDHFAFFVFGDGSCWLREPVCFVRQELWRVSLQCFQAVFPGGFPERAGAVQLEPGRV